MGESCPRAAEVADRAGVQRKWRLNFPSLERLAAIVLPGVSALACVAVAPAWAADNDCRAEQSACIQPCRGLERTAARECYGVCAAAMRACTREARAARSPNRTDRETPVAEDAPPRYTVDLKQLLKPSEGDEPRVMPLDARASGVKSLDSLRRWLGLRADIPHLYCQYGGMSGHGPRHLNFWHQQRQPLPVPADPVAAQRNAIARELGSLAVVDRALDACPPTWGEALETAFGPQVWDQVAANKSAYDAKLVADKANHEAQVAERQRKWDDGVLRAAQRCKDERAHRAKQQPAGVAPALLADAERDLACAIHAEVQVMEANIGGDGGKFVEVVRERIADRLTRLVAAAHAAKPAVKSATWKDFDRWERGVGGEAMLAMDGVTGWWNRVITREMATGNADAGIYRVNNPAATLGLIEPHRKLYAAHDELVNKLGMLEPVWSQRATTGLNTIRLEQETASEVARGAATPVPLPTNTMRRTVYLTPGQYVAAQIGADAGQAVGYVLRAYAEAMDARARLEADVRSSRTTFWRCYAQRCDDRGRSYADYLDALLRKDIALVGPEIARAGLERRGWGKVLAGGRALVGVGEIDGGAHPECENLLSRATEPASRAAIKSPLVDDNALIVQVLNSDAYTEYQICRDQMEFLRRPRDFH